MGFGIAAIADAFFRHRFSAAGLRPHSVTVDADTTIHCWLSSSSSPTKPPLVLLHGFGPPATWQWHRQVGPLAAHFALVVPDLLFFGGSSTQSPSARSEADQAAAVSRLLDALEIAGPVAVAGTSYGGFVAYHLARMLGPARVARVVVASCDLLKGDDDDRDFLIRAGLGGGGGAESIAEVMIPKSPVAMRRIARMAFHRPPPFMPDFVLNDIVQHVYSSNVEEKKELIKAVTLGKKDEFQLTPLPQEVLIIWGEHDQVFPLAKAFEIQRRLGDSAKLEIIKNTGHLPQNEDSKRFTELVLNFLLPPPPKMPE